ncbi:hypothetical protein [Azospirillum sp. TSO35-2]|uniref:hypothetical protein n=1 Tax=Azospirillum sp. TSO35-2 TaxID=716796 RepID=UPI000D608875|nr:hypothetical protein [Azospirillum sp. TSO35-2]PWC31420.1 hypothetical protein TSO352_32185 [Azospirillum sp. TSO35-2]
MRPPVLAVLGLTLLAAACGNTMEEKSATGGMSGVAAGALVGGPVGAVVGGVAGAGAGAATEKIEERNQSGSGASSPTISKAPASRTTTTAP